jgi:hypothetical protein
LIQILIPYFALCQRLSLTFVLSGSLVAAEFEFLPAATSARRILVNLLISFFDFGQVALDLDILGAFFGLEFFDFFPRFDLSCVCVHVFIFSWFIRRLTNRRSQQRDRWLIRVGWIC